MGVTSMIVRPNLVHVGWTRINGDLVLYLPKNETYFVLNDTGAIVWELIVNGETKVENIVKHLSQMFHCDPSVVKQDVLELVNTLKIKELIFTDS